MEDDDRRLRGLHLPEVNGQPRPTIFALSSGSPPAAIAVVRVSGPQAAPALESIAGALPAPRKASSRTLRDPRTGEVLDRGLILFFPGPASSTGEDVAELHLHGGRAVVAAVLFALAALDGLRMAEPGEFTRRSFENGRIDLNEAEGLADLLVAETEDQRRNALRLSGGALGRRIAEWEAALCAAAAAVEASLDHADESEVEAALENEARDAIENVTDDMRRSLDAPPAERLMEGFRVVIAGPPNSGKSSLLNSLSERDRAIVSPVPGTTRDAIEAPFSLGGVALTLVDTAGLRETQDSVEMEGIARATSEIENADLVLWLGAPADLPPEALLIAAKCDVAVGEGLPTSSRTGEGLPELRARLLDAASASPVKGESLSLNQRQRQAIVEALSNLDESQGRNPLLTAEGLRRARSALASLKGHDVVEKMLDQLFGRFCIGK